MLPDALGRFGQAMIRVANQLYVCDASVFPTSVTVNPQLTVMSLAHYAAPRIADGASPP